MTPISKTQVLVLSVTLGMNECTFLLSHWLHCSLVNSVDIVLIHVEFCFLSSLK